MRIVVWPKRPEWETPVRAAAGNAEVVTPASEAEALAAAADADGWIGNLNPALLAAAKKLRWLQSPTISLERVVFPELIASDIVVTKLMHVSDAEVSTHALTLFLALIRDLPRRFRDQQACNWNHTANWREISGMNVLILGQGGIGAELARRMAPLGAHITGVDPRKDNPGGVAKMEPPERLPELLAQAEAVICCAPLTPQTLGLFDEAMFRRMRPGALFVNVGRGQIVKTEALTQALKEGWIAAAAIDVVDPEPLPPSHPLWHLPNAIVTPHVASLGSGSSKRYIPCIQENVRAFVSGKPFPVVADKANWY